MLATTRRTRCRRDRRPSLWMTMVTALALSAAAGLPRSASCGLVLNEILSAPGRDWNADGTVHFKTDEWVEILNTGPLAESLDGVFLRDGTGIEYHYGFAGTLQPGGVRVVYGDEAVAWQTAQGLATTGLSLNNSGDRVELWRDQASVGVLELLDTVTVASHAAAMDRALGRDATTGAWALFDGLSPYTGSAQPGSTGCAPSPGAENLCPPAVPLAERSWGRVKAVFDAALP